MLISVKTKLTPTSYTQYIDKLEIDYVSCMYTKTFTVGSLAGENTPPHLVNRGSRSKSVDEFINEKERAIKKHMKIAPIL